MVEESRGMGFGGGGEGGGEALFDELGVGG